MCGDDPIHTRGPFYHALWRFCVAACFSTTRGGGGVPLPKRVVFDTPFVKGFLKFHFLFPPSVCLRSFFQEGAGAGGRGIILTARRYSCTRLQTQYTQSRVSEEPSLESTSTACSASHTYLTHGQQARAPKNKAVRKRMYVDAYMRGGLYRASKLRKQQLLAVSALVWRQAFHRWRLTYSDKRPWLPLASSRPTQAAAPGYLRGRSDPHARASERARKRQTTSGSREPERSHTHTHTYYVDDVDRARSGEGRTARPGARRRPRLDGVVGEPLLLLPSRSAGHAFFVDLAPCDPEGCHLWVFLRSQRPS